MKFEWDEKLNRLNMIKHGVSFEIAARAFADPDRLEYYEPALGHGLASWITIGMVHPAILVVVKMERNGESVRLISARQANEQEHGSYYHF